MSEFPEHPRPLGPREPADSPETISTDDVPHSFDPTSLFEDAHVEASEPSKPHLGVSDKNPGEPEHSYETSVFETDPHPTAPGSTRDAQRDKAGKDDRGDPASSDHDKSKPHAQTDLKPRPSGPSSVSPPSRLPFLILIAGEILLGVGLVYLFIADGGGGSKGSGDAAKSKGGDESKKGGADEKGGKGDSDPKASGATLASLNIRVDGLMTEVQGLSKRLDEARHRADEALKPPQIDLKSVQDRMDGLAKRLDATGPQDLKPIDDRLNRVATSQSSADVRLDALSNQVADLDRKLGETKALIRDAKPVVAMPTALGDAEGELARAIGFLKEKKYTQANSAFVQLTQSNPNDARGWYYAALTNGITTNQWTGGETERLITKAIEREKAGTPPEAQLDAAFVGLEPESAKDWINAYRARAR